MNLFGNKEHHSKHWLFFCSKQRVGEEDLVRLAEKGKDCTEEEINQGWTEYARSSMRDNVKPEIIERLETAASINRAITPYDTGGNGLSTLKAVRPVRYTPERKIEFDVPHKEGDLLLIWDNGCFRSLAEKV